MFQTTAFRVQLLTSIVRCSMRASTLYTWSNLRLFVVSAGPTPCCNFEDVDVRCRLALGMHVSWHFAKVRCRDCYELLWSFTTYETKRSLSSSDGVFVRRKDGQLSSTETQRAVTRRLGGVLSHLSDSVNSCRKASS